MENKMDFQQELSCHGLEIPYSTDMAYIARPLPLYGRNIPNRMGILPLEGFDSGTDGSPTPYVYRRYLRFAEGGAGLIWFEACAVSEDGKSNPAQMMLHDGNVDAFRKLLDKMDQTAEETGHEPAFKVLQLTHSGRLSRNTDWEKRPLSPKKQSAPDPAETASDERIDQMIREYVHAAKLAADAGFDAVDVKACHGYFLSEMLSAYHRDGKYGGSFENRTRALLDITDGIRNEAGNRMGIAVRLNAFDSVPCPDGFGAKEENGRLVPDLSEPVKLCKMLGERGVQLIDISASTPQRRLFGPEPEDPKYRKYGTACDYLAAVRRIKENVSGVSFMCTGLSAFGAYGGFVAAGGVKDGWFDIAGFGRQALAYPSFAADLLARGRLDEEKCCVNCNQCFSLMDPGHCRVGCIVRDKDEFYPLYRSHVLERRE